MNGLLVEIDWDGARVGRAAVAVHRPDASRLLIGRPPAEVIDWVPRLYSLCGHAQTAAATLALEAAQGGVAALDAAATRRLLAEQAQEHLWRLLRDWPPLFGEAPRNAEFGVWYRRLSGADAGTGTDFNLYLERHLFGLPIDEWTQLASREALAAWAGEARSGEALAARLVLALLDEAPAAESPRCLAAGLTAADFAAAAWDDEFSRLPTWAGRPANTGAVARWSDHPLLRAVGPGLLARLLARLLDLCATARSLAGPLPHLPLADACSPAENVGLARVDTARGLLLHRVELDAGRTAHYAVVAPTEWNFHPDGDLARTLAGLADSDEARLRRRIAAWVVAADPCVEWRLELNRA